MSPMHWVITIWLACSMIWLTADNECERRNERIKNFNEEDDLKEVLRLMFEKETDVTIAYDYIQANRNQ